MSVLRKLTIRLLGDRVKIHIMKATLKHYYSSMPICSVEYKFCATLILLCQMKHMIIIENNPYEH